jgi:ribosomal protein S18 acetylase RimI-like enzyme
MKQTKEDWLFLKKYFKRSFVSLKEFMAYKDIFVIRLRENNQVVGLIVYEVISTYMYIDWIAVAIDKRNANNDNKINVADYLIENLKDRAKLIGFNRIRLSVRYSNFRAIAFYLKSEFKFDTFTIFPDGDPGYYMEKNLMLNQNGKTDS